MIKLLLTTVTFTSACLVSQANAQIQNMNPAPGDVFNYEYFDLAVADSGSIGVNQTWDFSGATSLTDSYTRSYRALTAQEQADYPTANLLYTEDSDPTLYLFNASADSLTDLGANDFMYTNPIVMYKYPIGNSYNFSDNSGMSGVPQFTYNGTMQVFSQGTGTLVTPFGMYENVMKIRRKIVVNYSLGGQAEQVIADSYSWINADNKTELLTIEHSDYVNNTEEDETIAYFLKNGAFAGIEEKSASTFSLYPNPAADFIHVKSATETAVSYKIYSVAGALVQSGNYTLNQGIATGNLQSGEYILHVATADKAVSHVKFSKI